MSNPVSQQTLERRLEYSARDFLLTDPTIAALSIRERDLTTLLTPEGSPKNPLVLLRAIDEGRTKPYAPIRNLRLTIALRTNAKVASGTPDAFGLLCAAIEQHFESANLSVALHSPTTRGAAVMLATLQPGRSFSVVGMIRTERWQLEIRALRAEQTTTAPSVVDGAWVDGDGVLMQDGDGVQLVL